MIAEKTTLEILNEIQEKLKEAGYPVKVDIGKAEAGADIGLELYINAHRNWDLEKQISSIVWKILDKYGLIAFIKKHWKKDEKL
jgi:hypothetical protein